jgi:leucine dehydrogenase
VLPVEQILAAEVDVLAPCALGAALNALTIPTLRARIVAGAANNQLATAADGDTLAARGILYLPDYLVNAGGIVSVAREYRGEGEEQAVMAEVSRIGERVLELLDRSAASGRTPARESDAWARAKLVKAA